MDDDRIWQFEESLWLGDPDIYRTLIDDKCVMALPAAPHIFDATAAIEAVAATPRWATVEFAEQRVERPEEGLIVIAYRAHAKRDDESYEAYCTTTIRRRAHEDWLVVQHAQLPPLALS